MKINHVYRPVVILFMMSASGLSLATANILTVTSTTDSGVGSLRQAIMSANTHVGGDTIQFNIPTTDAGHNAVTGVWTIRPDTVLPALTDNGTVIDGTSQSVNRGDTNPYGPEIELDGSKNSVTYGITIRSANHVVKGLVINRWGVAIGMLTASARGNLILGNYIGTDATGMLDRGNNYDGIQLRSGSRNNRIGDGTVAGRNIICGTDTTFNIITGNGIYIEEADSNRVVGNYVGVNRDGTAAIPNVTNGVCMYKCRFTLVGGAVPGEGNVISGNGGSGVLIRLLAGGNNVIRGNFIGTDRTGKLNLGNNLAGIALDYGAKENTIGPGNMIAFNHYHGVVVTHDSTRFNVITQNAIYNNLGWAILNYQGGNRQLTPPTITMVKPTFISGTAAPNSRVEVFSDSSDEGALYEGTATANASGAFTWNGSAKGPRITATCTDDSGNTSQFSAAVVSVDGDRLQLEVPAEFSLNQNYPNPFNPSTVISYGVPVACDVQLAVYDLLGREVGVLVNERRAAGTYEVRFDASGLSSGIYIYRLRSGNFARNPQARTESGGYIQTRTMLLLQ